MGMNRGKRHGSCLPRVRMVVDSPWRSTVGCSRGSELVGFTAQRGGSACPTRCRRACRRGGWWRCRSCRRWRRRIVVLAAAGIRHREAGAVFDPQHRRQAEEGLAEVGLELVENRLAPAGGHPQRHDLGGAADRVAFGTDLLDQRDHLLRRRRVGAAHRIGFDLLERQRLAVRDLGVDIADLHHVAEHPHALGESSFLAIAPAATRAVVSRALERPPPRGSRRPYLASKV